MELCQNDKRDACILAPWMLLFQSWILSQAKLLPLKTERRKLAQSYNFSSHLEKILNCVLLNSIWQLADLDRRKRITVWNELHATLTYPLLLRIRARWLDKAVQTIAPWTQLRRLFCFISLGPRHSYYPQGAVCERTSLPAVCRAASCPYLC